MSFSINSTILVVNVFGVFEKKIMTDNSNKLS